MVQNTEARMRGNAKLMATIRYKRPLLMITCEKQNIQIGANILHNNFARTCGSKNEIFPLISSFS